MKKIIFFFLALLIFVPNMNARRGPRPKVKKKKGVLLGSRIVDFKAERDVIPVTVKEGRFKRLLFKVEGNDLEIFKIIVTYGNGAPDELPVKLIFDQGDRSRFIDLRGHERVIRKITFFYRTIGRIIKGKAEVFVFGIR